jgi:hypothetical protein
MTRVDQLRAIRRVNGLPGMHLANATNYIQTPVDAGRAVNGYGLHPVQFCHANETSPRTNALESGPRVISNYLDPKLAFKGLPDRLVMQAYQAAIRKDGKNYPRGPQERDAFDYKRQRNTGTKVLSIQLNRVRSLVLPGERRVEDDQVDALKMMPER